jgi:hypothetical protein
MTLDVDRKDRAEFGQTVGAGTRGLKEKTGFSRPFSPDGL